MNHFCDLISPLMFASMTLTSAKESHLKQRSSENCVLSQDRSQLRMPTGAQRTINDTILKSAQ